MQDRVYAHKITSVHELSDEWHKIDQQLIDSPIKLWHIHLAACAQGRHTERML